MLLRSSWEREGCFSGVNRFCVSPSPNWNVPFRPHTKSPSSATTIVQYDKGEVKKGRFITFRTKILPPLKLLPSFSKSLKYYFILHKHGEKPQNKIMKKKPRHVPPGVLKACRFLVFFVFVQRRLLIFFRARGGDLGGKQMKDPRCWTWRRGHRLLHDGWRLLGRRWPVLS
jgi:hypothetical protein